MNTVLILMLMLWFVAFAYAAAVGFRCRATNPDYYRHTSVGHGEIDTPTACTSQSIGRDLVHGQFHDGCGANRMDRLRVPP